MPWTPASLWSPMRWSLPPPPLTWSTALRSAELLKKLPSLTLLFISSRGCQTALPAPMVRWPGSLPPWMPSGMPTALPVHRSRVQG